MKKIDVSIGIPAYNEESNILNLLDSLSKQKTKLVGIKEVIVVDDGSSDSTSKKVFGFIKSCRFGKKIRFFCNKKRMGKWKAINTILQKSKSKIIVLESADTLPKNDCIEQICIPFIDKKIGIASSKIVPLNNPGSFLGFTSQLMYELHHEISLNSPKFGELIAFRKEIKEIPPTIVDEEQIASMISYLGYAKKYASSAIVYNKGPETISDFIEQRRRIYCGHLCLKKDKKYSAPTLNSRKIFFLTIKHIRANNVLNIIGASLLECYSRFLGRLDYISEKGSRHILWKQIKSVKNLENK
jgi:biofilm PGA synthesis N-glycosyltransferase PgaC